LSALADSDIPPMPSLADPSAAVEQRSSTLELFPVDPCITYLPKDGEDARVWLHCKYLVSQSKDICRPKSWIFFREEGRKSTAAGRVVEILSRNRLTRSVDGSAIAIVEPFTISEVVDPYYNMPLMTRSSGSAINVRPEVSI
ncbi:hypothetical protein PHLCEN_2v3000, partial [Hermanssonia centrifuga]